MAISPIDHRYIKASARVRYMSQIKQAIDILCFTRVDFCFVLILFTKFKVSKKTPKNRGIYIFSLSTWILKWRRVGERKNSIITRYEKLSDNIFCEIFHNNIADILNNIRFTILADRKSFQIKLLKTAIGREYTKPNHPFHRPSWEKFCRK